MTKEEFIDLAKQSSDRVDFLNKLGHPFSYSNIIEHIRKPRVSFGISVDELFGYFSSPTMSSENYINFVSGSINMGEVLVKMGYPKTEENTVKYIIDVGRKYGFKKDDIVKMFAPTTDITGSIGS